MTDLPEKTTTEIKTLTFNFAPDLTAGVTITSVAFTKSLVSTDPGSPIGTGVGIATPPSVADPGAASLTIGASQIVGQTVLVLIGGGIDGNHYAVMASATCSDGQHIDSRAGFAVYDSAA